MLALTLNDGVPRMVQDFELPPRAEGEVRVRTRCVGVCDTDLQLAAGYMGFHGVPGHEFVGEVVAADDRALCGTRVVADINAGCGRCSDCTHRDGHHCAERTVLGILGRSGAMAEELLVPQRCVVPVPDSVSDDMAVFAEPLAAAMHVTDALPKGLLTPVVVQGDGKLGLLIARALVSAGLKTVVVGRHRSKLDVARRFGASGCLQSESGDLGKVDALVEATGTAEGFACGVRMLNPRGTLVLKTTVADKASIDLAPIVVNELNVVGSRCGDMARAVQLLATDGLDTQALVSDRFVLGRADAALRRAAQKGTLKVLVDVP